MTTAQKSGCPFSATAPRRGGKGAVLAMAIRPTHTHGGHAGTHARVLGCLPAPTPASTPAYKYMTAPSGGSPRPTNSPAHRQGGGSGPAEAGRRDRTGRLCRLRRAAGEVTSRRARAAPPGYAHPPAKPVWSRVGRVAGSLGSRGGKK